MSTKRIVVIGAGVGGLVTAIDLARQGMEVTVVEKAQGPGGKMREIDVAGAPIDGGPTLFTMTWVFEELFADAGASFTDYLSLRQAEILARHAWGADEWLDLYADQARSADAIARLAGPREGERFRAFCAHARRVYETLEYPYLRSSRPTPLSLVSRIGFTRLGALLEIKPYTTMWRLLGQYFSDPRLLQLFGRYTTYVGASPMLAPATLMLMAQVEQNGIFLVDGGMYQITAALARLAEERGVTLRYATEAQRIEVAGGRAHGVVLASGERLAADAVVFNGDAAALGAGLLGDDASRATTPTRPSERSHSLMAWTITARTEGFPLVRHSYFYSADYPAEFQDVFERQRLPQGPTVYLCAQDRNDHDGIGPDGPERLQCLTYAPSNGDTHSYDAAEIEQYEERTFSHLEHFGLKVDRRPDASVLTTPDQFHRLFPGSGGAIYGRAAHGTMSSFTRPTSRSRIPGLYLAGGTTHPGPGVPMAAISGRLAAATLIQDLTSTGRSRRSIVVRGQRP
ncbi:1-hydroxycarotenoid 3,4-desaturase CrtD [Thiorhodovibrio frisius]|uniref:Phytoene desaturase n=1 Tax=Thiorhodovibrio frisius TaxID=631362 RepID=H8Z8H7_9GAMM|nr:1-hydroxycarotenoid 3,4-desaturase CrtD [Thiorhodovibrio frisius]EIC19382.1 phytoene desaturase [Thiorhodovibrio frisius]WPL22318.1 phytoene desaturase family protein [Thiorhodovibrio frisius]